MNANKRESFIPDDAFPFHFGLLKVNQKSKCQIGSFEVVKALSDMVITEGIDALQFDQDLVINDEIREEGSHVLASIEDQIPDLGFNVQP